VVWSLQTKEDVQSCGGKWRGGGGEKQSELEERTVVKRTSGLGKKGNDVRGEWQNRRERRVFRL
jgi:hypothetical protein